MASLKLPDDSLISSLCLESYHKLKDHIESTFLGSDGSLVGPDSGTRLNLRVWRFVNSYVPFLFTSPDRYYAQAQAYWIFVNALDYHKTCDPKTLDCISKCADTLLSKQTDEGYWVLSNPEWKGRITTVEGCFGGLGLLKAYEVTSDKKYLYGAKKSYKFLVNDCGFIQFDDDSYCIRYFANYPSGLVPNNATLAIWFFSELYRVCREEKYLDYCNPQVEFIARTQLETGELPYLIKNPEDGLETRNHYLCYQYNSFEFMDLVHYYKNTSDKKVLSIMDSLARYLSGGLTETGDARYDCHKDKPVVHYYTGAVAAANLAASNLGLGNYKGIASKAYSKLLSRQLANGGFHFSTSNYGFLSDKHGYPRNLSMTLWHLLYAAREFEKYD